jgi:hypothetical protein
MSAGGRLSWNISSRKTFGGRAAQGWGVRERPPNDPSTDRIADGSHALENARQEGPVSTDAR